MVDTQRRHRTYLRRALLTLMLVMATSTASQAQQCYIEQAYQCGPGTLCGQDGTCKPIATVIPGTIFWVDQTSGSDSNAGTQLRPWKTITRAAQGSELGPGDGVLVRAGTYYETIVPKRGGTAGNPITYAAYPGEEVIVSGAEPLTGTWTKSGNVWSMKWPYAEWLEGDLNKFTYNRGGVIKYDASRHRELVIANGEVLMPYFNNLTTWQPAFTPTTLPEGTFFIKGTGSLTTGTVGKPETIYIRLPGDANPNQAKLETSRKSHLFNASGNSECSSKVPGTTLSPHSHLRLAGFTFRHLSNVLKQGAVCTGSQGTWIDNIVVEWTNGTGVLLFGSNHVVRGVRAYYNGIDGFKGGVSETLGCDDCTLTNSVSKYNNWKGYDPFHESGGGKWTYTTNSLFSQLDFSENNGPGLWLDTENNNNIIERSRFHSNRGVNLFIEVFSNNNLARNNVSTMARTAHPAVGEIWYDKWTGIVGNRFIGHGMIVDVSAGNRVVYNTFMGNLASGLRIGSDERGDATDTGYYNNLFLDNVQGNASAELAYEKYIEVAPALTNHGGGNMYWPHTSSAYFTFHFEPKGGATIPGFETHSLPAWRTWSKTDATSTMVVTGQPHVVNLDDSFVGWMLAANTQFAGKSVALPAGVPAVTTDFFGNTRPTTGATPGAHQGSNPSIDVAMTSGFNLVGLPLDATSTSVTSLFPTSTPGTFLTYTGSVLATPNPAVLKPGEGYWLHFASASTSRVSGIPAASRTWTLRAGWNIVSGPTCAVSLDAVDDPSGAIDQRLLFGFEGKYVVPAGNVLVPGKGYWVFATKAATATLTCGSAAKTEPELATLNENVVVASKNATAELTQRLASLPPVPAALDARLDGLVPADEPLPTAFGLDQNYPNPFRDQTQIRFALPEAARVTLRVVDLLGREVLRVVDADQPAGWHQVNLSGESLSSGMYMYELTAGDHRAVRPLMVVR